MAATRRVPTYEAEQAAYQKAEAERLANMSWWQRAVNGAKTGYNEGSAFGAWGAIGGAVGGAADGAANGGVYKAHVKNGDTVEQGGGQGFSGGGGGGGGMMGGMMGGGGGGGGGGGSLGASRSAFGYVPYAAEYQPVPLNRMDYQGVQGQTLQGNLDYAGMVSNLMRSNGQMVNQTSRTRADNFSPDLWNNVGAQAALARQYMSGTPSWSDAMETVARSTGSVGANGTPGTGQNLTARDLGIMDMDLRQRGAAMSAQAQAQAEGLDPRANYGNPQDYQLKPSETIPWKMSENLQLSTLAMQQAESIYAADQNANNLAASPDPMSAGLYSGNLALSLAKASGGSKSSGSGIDWGSIIGGMASSYMSGKGKTTT